MAWSTILLAAVATAGCGGGQGSGAIDERIAAGDYQLTASGLENPAQPPDRFTNPKAGNRFVKLDVLIENGGSQHLPVAASHFTLRDTGGIENPALPGIPSDRGLKQTSVGPGQRLQTVLYFEMAAYQRPEKLVFAPAIVGWNTRITVGLPA